MTTKLLLVLKKWALPLVIFYALTLTLLSLVHIGDIPDLGSSFDDKIYHVIAYFVFMLLVYNYYRSKDTSNKTVISAIVVVLYGIIIEVLQNIVTSYRTFDPYDALANALGVILAVAVLRFLNTLKLKID